MAYSFLRLAGSWLGFAQLTRCHWHHGHRESQAVKSLSVRKAEGHSQLDCLIDLRLLACFGNPVLIRPELIWDDSHRPPTALNERFQCSQRGFLVTSFRYNDFKDFTFLIFAANAGPKRFHQRRTAHDKYLCHVRIEGLPHVVAAAEATSFMAVWEMMYLYSMLLAFAKSSNE